MNNAIKKPKALLLAGFIVLGCGAIAWQTTGKAKKADSAKHYVYGDTSKPRKQPDADDVFGMKDLDEQMKQLDEQMKQLDIQMQQLDTQLSKHLKEALAKIDFEKIGKDVDASLKAIDWTKMQEEIQSSMKEVQEEISKIDKEKIQREVQDALKEAQEEMKQVNMEKLKEEMKKLQEELKSEQLDIKIDGEQIRKEVAEAMKDAKESIKKAGEELKEMKSFIDELEKDGLVDKKNGFNIEWKNGGDLYINGQKQPKEVSEKYKKYYKGKDYQININKNDDKYNPVGESI